MPRIILLIAIIVTLTILIRRAQRQPPHKRRGAYLQIILGSAVIGVIILTLMGKMHWVGAALTGLLVLARQMLPLLIRFLPMLGSRFFNRWPSSVAVPACPLMPTAPSTCGSYSGQWRGLRAGVLKRFETLTPAVTDYCSSNSKRDRSRASKTIS